MKRIPCFKGRQFYQEWTHTIEQKCLPVVIQDAASKYFHHKNTCRQCCGLAVIFLNQDNTPWLFKNME